MNFRDNLRWNMQVSKLGLFIHDSGVSNDEKNLILSDLFLKFGHGTRYLEEVDIEKVSDREYIGTLKICDPIGSNHSDVGFDYEFRVPLRLLDSVLDSSPEEISTKKSIIEKQLEIKVFKGEDTIEGSLRASIVDYINEPVSYAIIFLEDDLRRKKMDLGKGKYLIPRVYVDE